MFEQLIRVLCHTLHDTASLWQDPLAATHTTQLTRLREKSEVWGLTFPIVT